MSVLPYYELHPGTGPHLLLVHGMLSSRAQWMLNLGALGQVCRPVVLELWGHGRSPSPADPAAYQPDAYVAAFERVREAVGAERWFVCGQSFGAALSLRYTLAYPDRVIAQAFTNSASALTDPEATKVYRETVKQRAESVRAEGLAALEALRIHPRHARYLPEAVKAALIADCARADPEGFALTFTHASPYLSVYEHIGENRVPTLYLHGDRERRLAHMPELVERVVPHVEIALTPGGHAVNIEAAAEFNQVLADFIRRHTPA
ncbi:MAG: alpha/beta hydrolase [Roseitalea porphyridii]